MACEDRKIEGTEVHLELDRLNSSVQYAGMVLSGGDSRRMGNSKPLLPFGPEPMLQRVVRLLGEAVQPVIVVAAPGLELPALRREVILVHDRRPGLGPLEGLASGLLALPADCTAAYVTSCDVPLLRPAFVRRMIELHAGHEIAVPSSGGLRHPLAAVYSRSVLPHAERLLAEDRRRLTDLLDAARTRFVAEDELRDVDPELASLRNLNQPAEYQAALAEAGFPVVTTHCRRISS
jgi:molybdopterin-guanine dinucleotide biosynthesis protein A